MKDVYLNYGSDWGAQIVKISIFKLRTFCDVGLRTRWLIPAHLGCSLGSRQIAMLLVDDTNHGFYPVLNITETSVRIVHNLKSAGSPIII